MAAAASVLAVAVVLLLRSGVPLHDICVYGGYVLFGIVLPGWLVHRCLRGPQPSWAAEFFFGGATGIVIGLGAWALASALDIRQWLWVWPASTVAVLVSRRLRRRVFTRPKSSWHPWTTTGVALAVIAALLHLSRSFFAVWALPPTSREYYPDLLWHMSLVAEATRALPLQTPQAVTAGALRYHWFANADIATGVLMTGLDVPTMLLRLWPALMVALVVGLVAVTGQQISRRQAVAPIAALLTVVSVVLTPWWRLLDVQDILRPLSPSQLYAFVPLMLVLSTGTALMRSRRGWIGPGVLLVAALTVSTGAKPTILPLVMVGSLVGLIAAVATRRPWIPYAALAVIGATFQVASSRLVSGGDSGLSITVFSSLTLFEFVRSLLDDGWPEASSLVLPGMFGGVSTTLSLLLTAAIVIARPLLGVAPLLQRELRRDSVAWWLAGMCGAGAAAFLLLAHPGYSQLYFAHTAAPIGAILGAWWLVAAIARRRRMVWVAAGGAVVGAACAWAAWAAGGRWTDAPVDAIVTSLAWSAVGVAVLAIGAAAVSLWRWRSGATTSGPVTVAVLAALFGGLIGSLPYTSVGADASLPAETSLAAAQSDAGVWVAGHTSEDTVLAVNDHCLADESDLCDSRVFWASGLGGRRVLLESWSYEARSAELQPDSVVRPPFDPDLLAFNQSLFTRPTIGALREAGSMGVEYLVATAGATDISPDLGRMADEVFRNDFITVYRLGH